jgi:hypothetical protein
MSESPAAPGATSPFAVPTRAVNVALKDVRYDAASPRIVQSLGSNASQAQIESMLLHGALRALDLIPSFLESGYIYCEPLVVKPSGKKYIVVEGNRRLAALRPMQKSDDPDEQAAFARHGLQTVPCLVFQGDERQLLAYLGLRHLSKTKDWSSSAKGAFVERIIRAGHDLAEAARLTNTSTPGLRGILLTRRLFERAADLRLVAPANEAEGETYFWRLIAFAGMGASNSPQSYELHGSGEPCDGLNTRWPVDPRRRSGDIDGHPAAAIRTSNCVLTWR